MAKIVQLDPKGLRVVAVFGGSGFLGRRVVKHLLDRGFRVRIAARHPHAAAAGFGSPRAQAFVADLRDPAATRTALEGAYGAVNAVSLYTEQGETTFYSVHVAAARRLARQAREAGVARFVQVSGIGSDPEAGSSYIRARGKGEAAVREVFPQAALVRPAVMFGPDDALLTTLVRLVRRLPVFPLFGRGETRLQPVGVEDVGEAVARLMEGDAARVHGIDYDLAGPKAYTYRELVELVAAMSGARTRIVGMPFAIWSGLAALAELVPGAGLTAAQVALMRRDTVPGGARPGLSALGIDPTPLEAVLRRMLGEGAKSTGETQMTDTTITKVTSANAPRGAKGQLHLASGKGVAMRLWKDEAPGEEKPPSRQDYETVGYAISGRAELHVEGQMVLLEPGDSWAVPKGAEHRYKILEAFTAVEATAPPAQVHGRES